jgi:hypothetical protein
MPYSDPFTALAYGPIVGERKRAQMIGAYDNPLTSRDIAVSPPMLEQYPLGSWVTAHDAKGNPIGDYRVGDTSYYTKDKPTSNTVEFRDADRSGQKVFLIPSGQVPGPGEVSPPLPGPVQAPPPSILHGVLDKYAPPDQVPTAPTPERIRHFGPY